MKISNEKQLEKILSETPKEKVAIVLNDWMKGVEWGSEVEAYRLIRFIQIWKKTLNTKMKTRDKIVAMINVGISERIMAHFSGIDMRSSSLKPHSIELLSYGLYGPEGMPKDLVKRERLNEQIRHDSLKAVSGEEVESISKASKVMNVDRATVRADRNCEEYTQGKDLIVQVLGKSRNR